MFKRIWTCLLIFSLCIIQCFGFYVHAETDFISVEEIKLEYKEFEKGKIRWSLSLSSTSEQRLFEVHLDLQGEHTLDVDALEKEHQLTVKEIDKSKWVFFLEAYDGTKEIDFSTTMQRVDGEPYKIGAAFLHNELDFKAEASFDLKKEEAIFRGTISYKENNLEKEPYLLQLISPSTGKIVEEIEITTENVEYVFPPVPKYNQQGVKEAYTLKITPVNKEIHWPVFLSTTQEEQEEIEALERNQDLVVSVLKKTLIEEKNEEKKITSTEEKTSIISEPKDDRDEVIQEEAVLVLTPSEEPIPLKESLEDKAPEVFEEPIVVTTPAEEPIPLKESLEDKAPEAFEEPIVVITPSEEPIPLKESLEDKAPEAFEKPVSIVAPPEEAVPMMRNLEDNAPVVVEKSFRMSNVSLRGIPTNPTERKIVDGWDVTEAEVHQSSNYTFFSWPLYYDGRVEFITNIQSIDTEIRNGREWPVVTWDIQITNDIHWILLGLFRNGFEIVGNDSVPPSHDYYEVFQEDLTRATLNNRTIVAGRSALLAERLSRVGMRTYMQNPNQHKNEIQLQPLLLSGSSPSARGDIETLTIYRLYDLEIRKVDLDGNLIQKPTTFEIRDSKNNKVAEGTSNGGVLRIGRQLYATEHYSLREISAPEGYEPSPHVYDLYINENGSYTIDGIEQESNVLTITNMLKPIDISIKKIDKMTGATLSNVDFAYYKILGKEDEPQEGDKRINQNGYDDPSGDIRIRFINNLGTNQEGIITLSQIREGKYVLKELDSPGNQGYQVPDQYIFLTRRADGQVEFFNNLYNPIGGLVQLQIWNYKQILPQLQIEVLGQENTSLSGSSWALTKIGDSSFSGEGHIQYPFTSDETSTKRYDQLMYLSEGTYRLNQVRAPDGHVSSLYEYELKVGTPVEVGDKFYSNFEEIKRIDANNTTVLWNTGGVHLSEEIEILDSTSDVFSYGGGSISPKILRIRIQNEENQLSLRKVDIEQQQQGLGGAGFKLYQVNPQGSAHDLDGITIYLSETSSYRRRGPNVPNEKTFLGETNVEGNMILRDLPVGHYFLNEETAPEGYAIPSKMYGPYSVLESGEVVKSILENNGDITLGSVPLNPLVIKNSPLITVHVDKNWEGKKPAGETIVFSLLRRTSDTEDYVHAGEKDLLLSTNAENQSLQWNVPKYTEDGSLYDYDVLETLGLYTHQSIVEKTNDYTFKVTNKELLFPLSLKKYDETAPSKPLAGAQFIYYQIVQKDKFPNQEVLHINGSDYYVVKVDEGEVSTNEQGIASVRVNPGSYILREVQAPEGYLISEEYIVGVQINRSGDVIVDENYKVEEGILLVPNRKKGYLPKTGGFGVYPFLLLGTGLMMLSIILNKKMNKRSVK